MLPKDLYPYEEYRHKYGQTHKKHKAFNVGLEEIFLNPDVKLYAQVRHQCCTRPPRSAIVPSTV